MLPIIYLRDFQTPRSRVRTWNAIASLRPLQHLHIYVRQLGLVNPTRIGPVCQSLHYRLEQIVPFPGRPKPQFEFRWRLADRDRRSFLPECPSIGSLISRCQAMTALLKVSRVDDDEYLVVGVDAADNKGISQEAYLQPLSAIAEYWDQRPEHAPEWWSSTALLADLV